MKKFSMVLLSLIVSIFFITFSTASSCNKDDNNGPNYPCSVLGQVCGKTVYACTNGSEGYYKVDDRKFWCSGSGSSLYCDQAAEDAVEYCCGKKSTEKEYEAEIQKLLDFKFNFE